MWLFRYILTLKHTLFSYGESGDLRKVDGVRILNDQNESNRIESECDARSKKTVYIFRYSLYDYFVFFSLSLLFFLLLYTHFHHEASTIMYLLFNLVFICALFFLSLSPSRYYFFEERSS